MSLDVIGLGAINLDVFYHLDDPCLLVRAGFPVVPGGEVSLPDEALAPLEDFLRRHGQYLGESGGGSAANTLYALARMGFSTAFLGAVGDDPAGDFLRTSLAPVNTSGVRTVPGRSGTCLAVLDRRGERTLMVFPQANGRLHQAGLDLTAARTARFVHLSSLVHDRARQLQLELVASLPPAVRVSLDPGEIYARKGLAVLEPLLRKSFIVFGTARELCLLAHEPEWRVAAQRLLDLGPSVVVCKRGAQGSSVFTREQEVTVPAASIAPVDTTGAGDVYNAGFLAGMLLGLPPDVCARLATAAAARSLTGRGREHYPDVSFLKEWLATEKAE